MAASAVGRARVGAVLEQRADDAALGRLVEVAHDRPPAVGLVEHAHGRDAAGQVAAGRQKAAYVLERRSTSRPVPTAVGDGLAEDLAPRAGDGADAGQGGVAGEPVGRDPVAGAHDAEERAGDRDPRGRPAPGRGGEGVEAEGVVEDAGVDRVGAGRRSRRRGRRCAAPGRAGRGRGRARRRPCPGRRGTGRSSASQQRRTRRGEGRRATARPRSRALPRRGAVLPSLGGSRISTRASVGSGPGSGVWLGSWTCPATVWSRSARAGTA